MLPNLSLNINTNIGDVTANLGKFSVVTADEMKKSAAAVGAFDSSVDAASKSVGGSAGTIGDSMKSATDSIISGSEAAAKAMEQNLANVGKEVADKVGDGLNTSEGHVKQYAGAIVDHFKTSAEQAAATAATFVLFGSGAATALSLLFNSVAVLTLGYKALHFAVGLVNGESYKSENIDALIAENKTVQDLQQSLHLTAVEAGAMNDALRRIGVNKADIEAVKNGVSSAVGGATAADGDSELDRLGVKYKNLSGQILDNQTVVQNAKNVLDQYTEGWDRNQAAAALGIGSYEQIVNYLKISQEELAKSKDRLDEYNLGIGPETQTAITGYENAMRQFHNEEELMSQSFKRAIADNIMPALTDLALFFKDGWPSVVNVFRYTMAEITSLGWGLKTSYDLVYDSLKGGLGSVADILIGIAKASALALTGDFVGAKNALVQGWDEAKTRIGATGSEIVKDAQHNAAAMKLAWAFDDRQDKGAGRAKKGKSWTPKPDAEDEEDSGQNDSLLAAAHSRYLAYLKAFSDREAAEVKAAAQQQSEINKEAYDWGLKDLQSYLDQKHSLSEKALQDEIKLRKSEVDRMGQEVEKYSGDQDAKGVVAYHDALAREQDAKKALIELEGKLGVLRLQNADESKKATHDQTVQYNNLAIQILELTGQYEKAAKARRDLERSDPKFKTLPKEIKDEKERLSASDIAKGRAQDMQNNIYGPAARLQNTIGGDNYGSQLARSMEENQKETEFLQAQYDARLISKKQFDEEMLKTDRQYSAEKNALGLTIASDSIGIMKQAFADNKAMMIAAMVLEKAIAIGRIMMNTEVAASAAIAAAAMIPVGGVATGAANAAAIRAMSYVSIGMIVASGAIEGMQIAGKRATGGPVYAGSDYLVGEQGPELFTPGATGTITPNHALGGVTLIQNNDFRGADPATEQRLTAQIKANGEKVKADILNSMNRGGAFALASGRMR